MTAGTRRMAPPLNAVAANAPDYLKVRCPLCAAPVGEPCVDESGERLGIVDSFKYMTYFGETVGVHGPRMASFRNHTRGTICRYILLFAPADSAIPPGTVFYGYGSFPLADEITAISTKEGGFLPRNQHKFHKRNVCIIEFTDQDAGNRRTWPADGRSWKPL